MTNSTPIVYAVQQARVNLYPATEFGTVRVVLPEGDISYTLERSLELLRSELQGFCADDYLLAVGDPTAIGMACALVSEKLGGRFKMLKWDKQERRYLALDVNLRAALTAV